MHEHKDWFDWITEWWNSGIPKRILGLLVGGFVSVITTEKQNKTLTFWQKVTIWVVSVFVGWLVYEWTMITRWSDWAFIIGMTASSFGATIVDSIRQLIPTAFKNLVDKYTKK